jgi:hypothetical protein
MGISGKGRSMDIHKPKAVHGWGELLREVGIIVLGVVIALGGEQAVDAIHWTQEVDAGAAALKIAFVREANNVALREALNMCIAQRIAALSSIVQAATESGRLPPIGAIGHPPFTPWTVGVWDALVAGQTVSHLPREKMIAYTMIVQRTAYLSALSDREEDQWTTLDSMAGPGRRLSDVEAETLRTTLAHAEDANRLMRATSENLRDALNASGLVDASEFADAARRAASATSSAAICRKLVAPASPG